MLGDLQEAIDLLAAHPGQQMKVINLKLPNRVVLEMDRIKMEQRLQSRTDVVLWLLDELPRTG